MKGKNKSQLKAGAILSYVTLFLNSGISILYTPIMLRMLGQSEYGLYSLAASLAGYIGVLNFGLGNAVIRYTAKYRAENDEEGSYRLFGMFTKMYGILGIVALIAGTILTHYSHYFFSNTLSIEEVIRLKTIMGIMTFNISIGIGLGLFSVIVLAYEKFIIQKMISIVSSIINPIIMLPLLYMGYGTITMAIVTTLINIISILINIYFCFKVIKIKVHFEKINYNLLKEIIIFSLYIFLNLVIGTLYAQTDQFILGIYSGTVAVSIYAIGATFTGYFSGFSSAISNVFLSKVSGMVVNEVSDKDLSNLFIRIGRIQYIVIAFAFSGFFVFGQEFISLWVGSEYNQSYTIALLILVPLILFLIQGMGGIILQAKNMHGFKTINNIFMAIFNVILSLIFVQWWGAIGCALATGVSYMIGNIIIMNYYYWRKINIDIVDFWKNILFMSAPLAISLLFGITLNKQILAESWVFLLTKIVVFSVFFLIIMWFTGMNQYERDLFKGPLKKINNKLRLKDNVA
ncbi:lipopolysaccharide biosynthesis protein [Fredinandcohnia humi]